MNLTVLVYISPSEFVMWIHLIWWWQCVPVTERKLQRNILNYRGRTVHWEGFLSATWERLLTNLLVAKVMGAALPYSTRRAERSPGRKSLSFGSIFTASPHLLLLALQGPLEKPVSLK